MINIINKIWWSPTITTWFSLISRVGGMLLLLPLVLNSYSVDEVAVWLLFGLVATLQVVGDLGLSQAFSRVVSYIRGGGNIIGVGQKSIGKTENKDQYSTYSLPEVIASMRPVYIISAIISFFLLMILAFLVAPAISKLPSAGLIWLAWIGLVSVTSFTVWGNFFQAFLVGNESVAILRRWEAIFNFSAIAFCALLIVLNQSLFFILIAQQLWMVAAVFRNRWLCKKISSDFEYSRKSPINFEITKKIWPSAWRGGVGVFMSYGIIQLSGIFYAKIAQGVDLAGYLLALRVMQVVSQASQAPFYSKIPFFTRLFAEGRINEMRDMVISSAKKSYFVFVLGFLLIGIISEDVFRLIGSQVMFPSIGLWVAMGIAFYFERMGGMHLQLYSVTGNIIWHKLNSITGLVMLSLSFFLYDLCGLYAFPLAMIFAYGFVYTLVSVHKTKKQFGIGAKDLSGWNNLFMIFCIFSLLAFWR